MTKEQFWEKFNELKEQASTRIDRRAEHLLNSGAIDLESAEDDYLLPKVVLSASLEIGADQFHPLSPEGKLILVNLRHF